MRLAFPLLSFAAIFMFLPAVQATAQAPTPFYDTFNYPNATPNGLNGNINPTAPATENGFSNTNVWTIGSSTHGPDVVSGDLSYAGLLTGTDNHSAQLQGNGTGLTLDRVGIGE